MGIFSRKKKAAQKEAERALEVQRAAEALNAQRARSAAQAQNARRAAADQKQDMAIQERKAIQEKITLWEKKVAKLEADKKVVLQRMLAQKNKGLKMNEMDKRKLAKVKRDITLTQGQLETLQNKLSGIEMAASNAQITDTIASANMATSKIAKPVEEVAAVLEEAENQQKDLEEANMEFMIGQRNDVDEDELLEDLNEFEIEQSLEQGVAAPSAAPAVPLQAAAAGIPSVPVAMPKPVPRNEEDDLEAELRQLELKGTAV